MKREYVGLIFLVSFVALIFIAEYFFDEETVMNNLSRFIVVWIMLAYQVGQYSMKFPKSL